MLKVTDFISDMGAAYKAADLVISRAAQTSVTSRNRSGTHRECIDIYLELTEFLFGRHTELLLFIDKVIRHGYK